MFEAVRIVGLGRVGATLAARLRERGVRVNDGEPELVLLCVPDGAIAEVAASVERGPWVAHVSGATPLAALDPHRLRFTVHPLQTFTRERGPEQLDGAFGGVTAESNAAREHGFELAATLGLRPFALPDEERTLYHAGAAFASTFLVTLHRAATALLREAGAPPEGLEPLMLRTIENGFQQTGPIVRGDWATLDAHLEAIGEHRPELLPLYRLLAEASSA